MRYQLDRFLTDSLVQIGEHAFRLDAFADFEAVVDELLKALSAKGYEDIPLDSAPYFGRLWPSALLLAEHLYERRSSLAGTTCLELGCGLGLPSMVAALSGAKVSAVDVNEDAITLLSRNFEKNYLPPSDFAVCDWQSMRKTNLYDHVFASDVLYERQHADGLATCLNEVLKPSGGFVVIDPCRWHYDHFVESCRKLGFVTEQVFHDRFEAGAKMRHVTIIGRRDR